MRSLKIPLAAALVWLEVGCGLPSPYFLAAPLPSTLAIGGTTAAFTNPGTQAGNQTTLAGFEVYYKFSASTPSGNDINLGGGGTPGPAALQADGFFPLCLATDTPPISRTAPMIAVSAADSATSFTVTLTISSATASTYSYTSPTQGPLPPVNIGRYIQFTTNPFTSRWFAQNTIITTFYTGAVDYTGSDTDQSLSSAGESSPYIILYALTYGFEAGTSIVQYSSATYLGYVQLSAFP